MRFSLRGVLRRQPIGLAFLCVVAAVLGYAEVAGRGNGGLPIEVLLKGTVVGSLLAVQAVGVVLVYRANRVINFAQVQLGSTAAFLFAQLVEHRTLIAGLGAVCPPCLPAADSHRALALFPQLLSPLSDDPQVASAAISVALAPAWMLAAAYFVSFALALAIAAGLTLAVYYLVIRPFAGAPRLLLTLATVGAGLFAVDAGGIIIAILFPPGTPLYPSTSSLAMPLAFRVDIGRSAFLAADWLSVILLVGVAVALGLFFRRSAVGTAMRASSENASRAATLGVNVSAISARAWLIAGLLSGLASLLAVGAGGQVDIGSSYPQLVRVLTVAVVGGLVSLPLVVIGGIGIGLMISALLFTLGNDGLIVLLLLALLLLLLLAQRARATRAEVEADGSWEAAKEMRPIPRELRGLAAVRRAAIAVIAGVSVVALALPVLVPPSQVVSITTALTLGLVGLSLLVLTGWTGQISLGQIGFAAIGAWVSAVTGLPMLLAIFVGGVAGMLAAVAVGLPALRLRGQHLAIVTLAFGLVVNVDLLGGRYLGSMLPPLLARPVILGINFDDERAFYYLTLGFVLLAVGAVIGMRRSTTARVMLASRDNEQTAQTFGIDIVRARLTGFAVSGFIAAVGGGLIAFNLHGVHQEAFSLDQSVRLFLWATIGGLSSIVGPLLGAAFLASVGILATTPLALLAAALASPGLGAVLVLRLRPAGLVSILYGLRDAYLRRVADRYRIVVPSLIADQAEDGLIPIAAKTRPGGGTVFVRSRFTPQGQWSADPATMAVREPHV